MSNPVSGQVGGQKGGGGGKGGGRGGGNKNQTHAGGSYGQDAQRTQEPVTSLSMIPPQTVLAPFARDVNADATVTVRPSVRGGGGPSTILGVGNGAVVFQIHSRHIGALIKNARRAFSESFISAIAYAEDNAISPVTSFMQHALRALPLRLGGTARDDSISLGPESDAIIKLATRYLDSTAHRGVHEGDEANVLDYEPIRPKQYDIFEEPDDIGASAGDYVPDR